MRFVFTRLFYALLAIGFIPLSLSWGLPELVQIERRFGSRFAVGAETEVRIEIANHTPHIISLQIKDEFPPQMKLSGTREARIDVDAQSAAALVYGLTPPKRGRFEFGQIAARYLSRWRLVWCQTRVGQPAAVKVYPNMRRAREVELKALGT